MAFGIQKKAQGIVNSLDPFAHTRVTGARTVFDRQRNSTRPCSVEISKRWGKQTLLEGLL